MYKNLNGIVAFPINKPISTKYVLLNCNVIQRECQTLINAITQFEKLIILHDFVLAKRCQNVEWPPENCGYVSMKMLERNILDTYQYSLI